MRKKKITVFSDAVADIIGDVASAIANDEYLRTRIARAIAMIADDVEKLGRKKGRK